MFLADLRFLLERDVPVRLVFIYFCGDNWGGKRWQVESPNCPKEAAHTALRDGVLTHPTLVEGLIPLFSSVASAHNAADPTASKTYAA